jgi:hypothetical protein
MGFLLVLGMIFFPLALVPPLAAEEPDPELILRAYSHAFPGRAGDVIRQNGDWTIQAGGETFYWAGGRILPEARRGETAAWLPHSFSIYPQHVPPPELYSREYIEALRTQGSAEAGGREDQHRGFQAALYGGLTRGEVEALLERIDFLGNRIVVHRDIVDALKRVEFSISQAALQDAETAAFVASTGQIGGYNWREIRGSSRMSYHSWGLAVDIQPKDPGGKGIYWRWERARDDNWMILPLERRWKPPDRVIAAFEREGFIWGGKWALYDTMHFEYRPELHEINRLLAAGEDAPGALPTTDAALAPTPAPAFTPGTGGQDLHHLYPAFDQSLIQRARQLLRRINWPAPRGP